MSQKGGKAMSNESKHTAEPWQYRRNQLFVNDHEGQCVIGECNTNFPELSIANARRIAACVNACAGISTENLEDNLPVKELADRYNAVLKQRDMLLETIEKIAEVEVSSGDISACWTLTSAKHLAQDVVEKVKGGAA